MSAEFGQLVLVESGIVIPLSKSRCVIGRAANCDVVLANPSISSKHCLLEFRDGTWFVTDLASSNGVRINGIRCSAGPLPDHSILSIAKLRFEVRSRSAAPASAHGNQSEPVPDVEPDSDISQLSDTEFPVNVAAQSAPPESSQRSRLGNLIPLDGGTAIPLKTPRVLVGRSSACNVILPHAEVSGKHCQLELQDGMWYVRDLGSRNGIRVNDKAETAAILKPNSILSIAKRKFRIEYELPANDPKPVMPSGLPSEIEIDFLSPDAKVGSFSDDDFSLCVPDPV